MNQANDQMVPIDRVRMISRRTLELQNRVLELRQAYLTAVRLRTYDGRGQETETLMLSDHADDLWKAVYQPHPSNPAGEASVGPERGSARPTSLSERPPGGPVSEASEGGLCVACVGGVHESCTGELEVCACPCMNMLAGHTGDPITAPAPPPESLGAELEWLLHQVGTDAAEVLRRVCERLQRGGTWERMISGELLNDDQVITATAVLAQELMASVGHLRPKNVRLSYHLEIRESPERQ